MIFGDESPTIGAAEVYGNLLEGTRANPARGVGQCLIVADSCVVVVWDGDDTALIRYDLATRTRIWSMPLLVLRTMSSDGARIFALAAVGSDGKPTTGDNANHVAPVAISFKTGELLWTGPSFGTDAVAADGPIVAGPLLYLATHRGHVFALDTATGTSVWTYEPATSGQITAQSTDPVLWPRHMTANDRFLFVSQPGNVVRKLDRQTGEDVGGIELNLHIGRPLISTFLQSTDTHLAITTVGQKTEDTSPPRGQDYYPTRVLTVDSNTLEVLQTVDTLDIWSPPVLLDTALYLTSPLTGGGMHDVWRVDLATGNVTKDIAGIESASGLTLTAAGSIVMVADGRGTVWFVDVDSGALRERVTIPEDILATFQPMSPVIIWDDNPMVVAYDGTVVTLAGDDGD
jgi:outer membrane protein assembly factor BamB